MGWFKKLFFIGCVIAIVFLTGFDDTTRDWFRDDSENQSVKTVINMDNCSYTNPRYEDNEFKFDNKECGNKMKGG